MKRYIVIALLVAMITLPGCSAIRWYACDTNEQDIDCAMRVASYAVIPEK
jgi:hypothetical protein